MNKLPLARSRDIVVQELGKEILIYDLDTHKAYNLNETASTVYQACDGKTTFDELKRKNKFTDDLIFLALDQLKGDNLIEEDNSFISPFNGMSRREVIRKVGLASVVALPVISSLIAPTAIMAQSCINPGGAPSGTLVTADFESTCASCEENLKNQCCEDQLTTFNCGPGTDGSVACNGTCRFLITL